MDLSKLCGHWLNYHITGGLSVNYGISHTYVLEIPYLGNKVHGANMGPTWVLLAPDGPNLGPMNVAIGDNLPLDQRFVWWGRCCSKKWNSPTSIGRYNFGIHSDTTVKHAESNNTNAPNTNNTNLQNGPWFNMASPPQATHSLSVMACLISHWDHQPVAFSVVQTCSDIYMTGTSIIHISYPILANLMWKHP